MFVHLLSPCERRQLVPAILTFLALTLLVGVLYPLAVTGVSQIAFGDRADGSAPIIPISGSGTTDLYAVTFGLDALHGASVANTPLMTVRRPDYQTAGAVKSGEVEMGPVATVLRNTRSSGVLRAVKVQ